MIFIGRLARSLTASEQQKLRGKVSKIQEGAVALEKEVQAMCKTSQLENGRRIPC